MVLERGPHRPGHTERTGQVSCATTWAEEHCTKAERAAQGSRPACPLPGLDKHGRLVSRGLLLSIAQEAGPGPAGCSAYDHMTMETRTRHAAVLMSEQSVAGASCGYDPPKREVMGFVSSCKLSMSDRAARFSAGFQQDDPALRDLKVSSESITRVLASISHSTTNNISQRPGES